MKSKILRLLPVLALALLARPSSAQQIVSSTTLLSNVTVPAGMLTSASALVPADLMATLISFGVTASQAQLNDPANGFAFEVDRLDDDGVWREDAGFTWQGGLINNKAGTGLIDNPGPSNMTWDQPPVGKQVRFVLTNQQTITGVTVTDQFLN